MPEDIKPNQDLIKEQQFEQAPATAVESSMENNTENQNLDPEKQPNDATNKVNERIETDLENANDKIEKVKTIGEANSEDVTTGKELLSPVMKKMEDLKNEIAQKLADVAKKYDEMIAGGAGLDALGKLKNKRQADAEKLQAEETLNKTKTEEEAKLALEREEELKAEKQEQEKKELESAKAELVNFDTYKTELNGLKSQREEIEDLLETTGDPDVEAMRGELNSQHVELNDKISELSEKVLKLKRLKEKVEEKEVKSTEKVEEPIDEDLDQLKKTKAHPDFSSLVSMANNLQKLKINVKERSGNPDGGMVLENYRKEVDKFNNLIQKISIDAGLSSHKILSAREVIDIDKEIDKKEKKPEAVVIEKPVTKNVAENPVPVPETRNDQNLENKKDILLQRWQERYDSYKTNDNKVQEEEKFAKQIKDSGIEVQYQSFEKLSGTLNVPREELFSKMPEIYKSAPEKDLEKYGKILLSEIVNSKNDKDRYDKLDKIIKNTPADVIKKMTEGTNSYLAQQVNEMLGVYGQEIGNLMKKTEDSTYRSPQDLTTALNYMGSAGRFMDKEKITEPVQTMVKRLLDNNVGDYRGINYANLCEAGFTDEVEKILSKGMKELQVGVPTIMGLKEKGYLNDEQVKKLALEANAFDIEKTKRDILDAQQKLDALNKNLETAETASANNPDNIVTIDAYGLGKGRAGDLIVKYRENMQRDIKYQTERLSSSEIDLKKLEI